MIKKVLLKIGTPLIEAIVVAVAFYFAFRVVNDDVWILFVAFLCLVHIIFFSLYLVEKDGVAWRLMKKLCGWYVALFQVFKEGDISVKGGFLVMLYPIAAGACICTGFGAVVSLIIAPIAYTVECIRGKI